MVRIPPATRHVLLAACLLALLSAMGQAASGGESAGEALYRRGIAQGGGSVNATVQGDLRVRSTEMPCVNCHRRSGWGTSEGSLTVPPIAAPLLFRPVTQGALQLGPRTSGPGTRPAYDGAAAILAAVRDGVNPAGRTLSPTMPRYGLSEADAVALTEYLKQLGAGAPPGVTDSQVHLATIVTDGVSPERRASVLDVLRTFARAKNAGTRYEDRRREHGPWDMKQHYSNYRDWVLHEWVLTGAPAGWPAQLDALYAREPVFAILGSITDEAWTSIDAFSARHGIPSVLPQTPLPPAQSNDRFYTFYFSRGVALEAETLARHLLESAHRGGVLQLSRCNSAGSEAAAAFTQAAGSTMKVTSRCIPDPASLGREAWRDLVRGGAESLVLWLDERDQRLVDLAAREEAAARDIRAIYLSSTLLGGKAHAAARAFNGRAQLLQTVVAPETFDRHAGRALTWFKANKLSASDPVAATNAFFAATLVADALMMPGTLGSREYFIERLEHMAGRTAQRSAYERISFDATRRFGSVACYILKVQS
jgi:hypothetical protein